MSKRAEVLAAARALIGTAFVHQGRAESGIDCAGTVVLPLRACGIQVADRVGYDRWSSGTAMPSALSEFADRIPLEDARPGDLLTFWRYAAPKPGDLGREEHVAWLSAPGKILHGWIKGGVNELSLDGHWKPKLVGAWRVRGID